MNRLKCPECGLVNFGSAFECKRCHFRFSERQTRARIFPQPAAPVFTVLDQLAPEQTADDSALQKSGAAHEPTAPFAPLPEYFDGEAASFTLDMILFAVTVGLSILFFVYQLHQYYSLYGGAEWKALTDPKNMVYVPFLEPFFYLEWIIKLLAIFASALLIIPFLRKSYAFLKVGSRLSDRQLHLHPGGWLGHTGDGVGSKDETS